MSKMVGLLEEFDLSDGVTESRLKGVRLFKSSEHIPRIPLTYDPGICIVAQGRKVGFLGEDSFQYDPDNYLVVSVTIPLECEVFGRPDYPLLGLYIDIDMAMLHELYSRLGQCSDYGQEKMLSIQRGVGPAPMDKEMADAAERLLRCLHSETETQILGQGLVREILFRTLCGTQASALHALFTHNGNFARVARALKLIHSDYASSLDIEGLSRDANMSISAFHRAFKDVTSDSPMQYLKKIRLSRARDFMVQNDMKAYIAAHKVGYESASQFSREFKRYFGQSPTDMAKEMRAS